MTIAGHAFDLSGRCPCGKKIADIMGVSLADIGQNGWAHVGALNERECSEILAERDRLWKAHLESGVD